MVPYWIATGAKENRFSSDLLDNADVIHSQVSGKRVLLVGGAGSIGSATLRALLGWQPREIVVADVDENGLAELGHELRFTTPEGTALRLVAVDYGSQAMRRLLDGGVDLALNFAALKHVHSERDLVSLLQMVDTNVLKQARFIGWLSECGCARYFNVSTDKAADPRCFMGATKRAQESLLWGLDAGCPTSSSRFANVAFSRGSVLDIWSRRLARHQDLVVTTGVRRHFMSTAEAGTLCMLAAACTPPRTLLVPDLCASDEVVLTDLADALIEATGALATVHEQAAEAYEKASESFVGAGEALVPFGKRTRTIRANPVSVDLLSWLGDLETLCACRRVDKPALARALAPVAPGFCWEAA